MGNKQNPKHNHWSEMYNIMIFTYSHNKLKKEKKEEK